MYCFEDIVPLADDGKPVHKLKGRPSKCVEIPVYNGGAPQKREIEY